MPYTKTIKFVGMRDPDGFRNVFFEDGSKKFLEHFHTAHYTPVPGDCVVFEDDGSWRVVKQGDSNAQPQ